MDEHSPATADGPVTSSATTPPVALLGLAPPAVPAPQARPVPAGRPSPLRPAAVRVVVRRICADGTPGTRWTLDTRGLRLADARGLSVLVDTVEAAGPPAGGTAALGAWRDAAGYEITVSRGFGHWIARIRDGHLSGPLAALVEHIVDGDATVTEPA